VQSQSGFGTLPSGFGCLYVVKLYFLPGIAPPAIIFFVFTNWMTAIGGRPKPELCFLLGQLG